MNNLTNTLLKKNSKHSVDENVKQTNRIGFDNSTEQVVSKYSIPSMSVTIDYTGLTDSEFQDLRDAYENNYANTFICDFRTNQDPRIDDETILDKRPSFMTQDSAVWVFQEFKFAKTPYSRVNGTITLYTSVFFNFSAYQDLYSESSSYTTSKSSDRTFIDIIDEVGANQVDYSYVNNTLFSNIGKSAKYIKDKDGLKRKYTLRWVTNETKFNKLLTFYRKKSGAMGLFGMSDYAIDENLLFKARFMNDSMKYARRIDGLYECELEIVEVK